VVTAPGLEFKHPLQSVWRFDRRLFVYAAPPSEFLTVEKTPVLASGTILWRVADPKRYFETVIDRRGAESRLGDILSAELGAAIGSNSLAAFVSTDAAAFRADAIVGEIARRSGTVALRDYGIEVVDVQLRGFDFPKQNRLRLYARMKSERGRISMLYRSEGEEEGLKVRAAAEEQKARILGKAIELSQQRRGEGDGEAARIYANALRQAPEFYAFLRAMEASRTFARKNTTMVFSVKFTVNLIKGKKINWPRLINDNEIMSIGSTRPLIDALRLACVDMVDWLMKDYGFERYEAAELLGQTAHLYIANVVDPQFSVACALNKKYLPK
jgi:membrane protease subunit HflC